MYLDTPKISQNKSQAVILSARLVMMMPMLVLMPFLTLMLMLMLMLILVLMLSGDALCRLICFPALLSPVIPS